jgi:hypothetical protein
MLHLRFMILWLKFPGVFTMQVTGLSHSYGPTITLRPGFGIYGLYIWSMWLLPVDAKVGNPLVCPFGDISRCIY